METTTTTSASAEQRLDENANRLPEGFFPKPQQDVSMDQAGLNKGQHKRRIIVIAYDHSNYSDAMIAKAIHLSLINPTDDIRLINVVSQSDYRTMFSSMLSSQQTSGIHEVSHNDTIVHDAADAMLWEIIKTLKQSGFENVSSEVLQGDPKASITDFCRIVKPAYLLTGSRGLGAVKRAVLGSVSSYLTKHCPCPVLVIKLDNEEIEARKELHKKKEISLVGIMNNYKFNNSLK
ncbi:uncharacterized protein BX663DRAFT_541476 [Cokeromyces recurvatus]|uniref:uncharacterized protein n=1 Tax=Cokeromyces recurvatus TaxID=90255 RepID=UPI002220C8D3|nr:uncharacterized protein BX663DRAFT_541476 [Cokeromyces recurvatus]KAI7905282.1 hypothetical protein BX663DRAFT_541476 [Cokeromyces recurvatus]